MKKLDHRRSIVVLVVAFMLAIQKSFDGLGELGIKLMLDRIGSTTK